jgi:hypothetical protein
MQMTHFKIIVERDNILMAARHAFQDCDLIPHLCRH